METPKYALALTIIPAFAAIYAIAAVTFGNYPPDNAALLMAALSTLISATSLSCMIITTTNQQRDKNSRTSLEPNGSTGSTKINPEPNFRQFNHQRKQKHYKQNATKGKQ